MSDEDSDSGDLVIDEKYPLSACPVKFQGLIDKATTDDFISKVQHYKDVNGISNENALSDLCSLFQAQALSWWNGVKDAVNTWEDAITLIRYIYAPTRPPHLIYSDIFQQKQENTRIEEFIKRKRQLFKQLPKQHSESVQIDMIFWMLNPSIRQKVPRESVETFEEIIQKAKDIENHNPSNDVQTSNPRKRRKRCAFCRIRGHNSDECRQRAKRFADNNTHDVKTETIE